MSLQRTEYLRDLISDAQTLTDDPQIIAAIVLGDCINGLRKSVLELANVQTRMADAQTRMAEELTVLTELAENNIR